MFIGSAAYASAALAAGVPAKAISERLGHATAAFTLQTLTHVLPGMDRVAADTVANLILGSDAALPEPQGRGSGSMILESGPEGD